MNMYRSCVQGYTKKGVVRSECRFFEQKVYQCTKLLEISGETDRFSKRVEGM